MIQFSVKYSTMNKPSKWMIEYLAHDQFVGDFYVGHLPFHVGDPTFCIAKINYIDAQIIDNCTMVFEDECW